LYNEWFRNLLPFEKHPKATQLLLEVAQEPDPDILRRAMHLDMLGTLITTGNPLTTISHYRAKSEAKLAEPVRHLVAYVGRVEPHSKAKFMEIMDHIVPLWRDSDWSDEKLNAASGKDEAALENP